MARETRAAVAVHFGPGAVVLGICALYSVVLWIMILDAVVEVLYFYAKRV